MGLAKNDYITCEERGFYHCSHLVCRDCIGNKSLKEHISKNGFMSTCHYCGKRRKVVELEDLMDIIMSGIRFQYEDAENYIFDNEYSCNTYTTDELIRWELSDELQIENEDLVHDICDTVCDRVWCEVDPYAERKYETELYSWHSFCDLVKYKMRYVFYKGKNVVKDYDLSNPVDILETIDAYVQLLKLIKRVPVNTKIYRGRLHNKNEVLDNCNEFGPPPIEYAKANRMSAEGISLFYAAYDEETVLKEIDNDGSENATIASFKVKRPLTVLDLSKLKNMKLPSIFDEKERRKRSSIIFLKSFAEEISKKVDKLPSIEYIPTQIVTEYFRYVFKSEKYGDIDGIVYNSSQNEKGYCIVLFMDYDSYKNDEDCMVDKSTIKLSKYKKHFLSTTIE